MEPDQGQNQGKEIGAVCVRSIRTETSLDLATTVAGSSVSVASRTTRLSRGGKRKIGEKGILGLWRKLGAGSALAGH